MQTNQKPLSFTIFVVADFSGRPEKDLPKLRLRRVITVDNASYAQLHAHWNREPNPAVDASWLGLKRLVEAVQRLPEVKVKIWDASKDALFKDLRSASDSDQTYFFKMVFLEELGTLGDEACGLIVGDFYLSKDSKDVELAKLVQTVAAMAGAPFVCGVLPEFQSSQTWTDVKPSLDGQWMPNDWPAVSLSSNSDSLFCLLPRWRSRAKGTEEQWLHPAYLVAALVAGAMNADGLKELGTNLFRAWTPALRPNSAPFIPMDFFWDVEWEWNCEDVVRQNLLSLGLNAITDSIVRTTGALENLVPVGRLARPKSSENFASRLLAGRVFQELQTCVRRLRTSDRVSTLERSLRDWVKEFVPRDADGNALFAIHHIAVKKDHLIVVVMWHQVAGGGLEQLSLHVPGLIDDRAAVTALAPQPQTS